MDSLLRLRGRAALLTRRRRALERVMLDAVAHTEGCLVEKCRKCGRPGCRCARGELHGPSPHVSRSQYEEIETSFDDVSASKFWATIYLNGEGANRCKTWIGLHVTHISG